MNRDNQTTNENTDIINKKILDSILDDDDEQFSQLISQLLIIDSDLNYTFKLPNYKLPQILSSSPSYACLCAFFSAKKCFESLINLIPDSLNSLYFQKHDNFNHSLVHFACAGGNLDIIRKLEQANFKLNEKDLLNKTPSHYSAMFGRTDVIKYLWAKGVEIPITTIHEACKNGNLDVVKFICENVYKNALMHNYWEKGKTSGNPLHLACIGGHVNIVKYILSNKTLAEKLVNENDCESRTPLICACQYGNLECVKILIQFGHVKNVHRRRIPLIEAAANGHSDIVQYLLMQKNCDINATNSNKLNAIEVAVINGHFEVAEILIKNGAIKNYNETKIGNLFLDACGTFNIEMVKFLDKMLDIPYETMGEKFMKQAVKIENRDLVTFLLEKNCKLNNNTCSSINFKTKWTPFMSFLKKKGADFSNLRLENGDLLIVHSIHEYGSLNTVKELISEGVVLNKQIISEYNLILTVISIGSTELFDLLLSFKPEIKDVDECFNVLEDRIRYIKNRSVKLQSFLKMAEALLRDYNADPNNILNVNIAFSNSLIDILELFSKYNSDFSNIRINCTDWANHYDPSNLSKNLEFLKDKKVDINKILSINSYPLIVEAIKTGKSEIVQDLISKGFELNSEIISKFDLIYEISLYGNINLFNLLLSFKPTITNIKSSIIRMFSHYMESFLQKDITQMKNDIEMIKTLFIQYDVNPNNEIFINFAVQYKLIDILDLLVEFNVDFNCCYLDYSSLVSHDYLEVFSHLEKHGCLFQKAKYCNINLSMLPYSYTDEKEVNLFRSKDGDDDENETSAIQENMNSNNRSDYDVNTLLFLLKYSTNDDIIRASYKNKNIIDILLKYQCFSDIISIFTKLNEVLLPNSFDVEKFKELISKNVNMNELTDKTKFLINSLIN